MFGYTASSSPMGMLGKLPGQLVLLSSIFALGFGAHSSITGILQFMMIALDQFGYAYSAGAVMQERPEGLEPISRAVQFLIRSRISRCHSLVRMSIQ
ncbi:hypothetical protein BDV37DRAFT_250776 [Aspergillus pseudonomiae]|uniref:Uncharacterized protein n=1 Tax=Aspergillus pseudonomiae TaxID=1506151 RepID=A0A5N7DAG9_9EURO|nr:uncharacterized protein BDV37DRAFT_250776 [Aspergillus pseudonomiae]KAE8403337.1 hypothetical protein BDV37DRAFT_250776 [Aspergillus pseudonomiae]